MIEVAGRSYSVPRGKPPRVAICLDGSDPSYFEHADLPTISRWRTEGFYAIAQAAAPTFTNPNNVSIITGAPPAVHGIAGNHFFDGERDVPMNQRKYIETPTILEALVHQGCRVLAVTAKDKLTKLIHPGAPGDAFSAESKGRDVYTADASLFVLDAGIEALASGKYELLYLSTTDYVQHKHAPGTPEARAFYEALDARLGRLDALGAIVALTADHGMNDKTRADGSPNVVYLSPLAGERARVTLPITDPYVVHHGSLGGCAMIYVENPDQRAAIKHRLQTISGIERVLDREEAAAGFELPARRIGDLVVFADRSTVLGKSPADHQLTHVARGLRSHGSLHEAAVPLLINRIVEPHTLSHTLRNRDLFDLLLNRAA